MDELEARLRLESRRRFIAQLGAGASVAALGGFATLASSEAQAAAMMLKRPDGRPSLPPGQRLLTSLKQMGGTPGDPSRSQFRLRVHGEVEAPFELDFRQLLAVPQVKQPLDVHCVTGWSVLGAVFEGVRISTLADKAKVKPTARHVIFEAAHGYTANVRIKEALGPQNMLAHRLDGKSLGHAYGGPVRGVVPDLYFWKSAKWITGIRFVRRDEPGFWEVRGYHNHADPWLEERHSR
jgi:DMSO/TMAO reductase YedYZ molybdopterin-dependent catalytic subunit